MVYLLRLLELVLSCMACLLCPDFRCSAHSVDGCWKQIARSETMSVNEVKTLHESLKPVVKHFKFSSKSKELLDNCMAALEMCHSIYLMIWRATRMTHFLKLAKGLMNV